MPSTSLYVHIPWCIKKCPYCDFNSHVSKTIPEALYIDTLIQDLKQDITLYGARPIQSIFIGGGTPSLFSSESYIRLLDAVRALLDVSPHAEITLEANPGTVEAARFAGYLQAGINRLSIGVQSFQKPLLQHIGRIHDEKEAYNAVRTALEVGFQNINLDIMYGLPKQTLEQGLEDLEEALSFPIQHLSWYQFTLEPNTYFYKYPPPLPKEHTLAQLEEKGLLLLEKKGFTRYEISAFAKTHRQSQHNLNYWQFGDYYGIGAGAHGKLSGPSEMIRTEKPRVPKSYLESPSHARQQADKILTENDLRFEYFLNTTRLEGWIALSDYSEKTGLPITTCYTHLEEAEKKGLIELNGAHWRVTPMGRRFTNILQVVFLG